MGDAQCHAQLRAMSEQRAKVLELTLRERERESELTASRLESARAEAEAARRAAEMDRLQAHQVGHRGRGKRGVPPPPLERLTAWGGGWGGWGA